MPQKWKTVRIFVSSTFLDMHAERDHFVRKDIKGLLLATGDEELIENSKSDFYWGCGWNGTGLNKLGKILMAFRSKIRLQARQQI
jgi:predicted NAD-dependent protein-ADP-ribosyltransferase YbiA (DUF1768 family)